MPFAIVRRPGLRSLYHLLHSADVVFQNNISLGVLLPALVARKPVLLVHQTWIRGVNGQIHWNDRLKLLALQGAANTAISAAVARALPVACKIIPNPYRDNLFRWINRGPRAQELIFVGRLVSDKGVDILLRALALLRQKNFFPSLTIVGDGPEREQLQAMAADLNLPHVTFAGAKQGVELVNLLNAHRLMVVPSRWPEPFGIVALEGIACGCVVIGSTEGGLAEAIGPCGVTFSNGDAEALAGAVQNLLENPELEESFRDQAAAHLAHFEAKVIANRYLDLLARLRP